MASPSARASPVRLGGRNAQMSCSKSCVRMFASDAAPDTHPMLGLADETEGKMKQVEDKDKDDNGDTAKWKERRKRKRHKNVAERTKPPMSISISSRRRVDVVVVCAPILAWSAIASATLCSRMSSDTCTRRCSIRGTGTKKLCAAHTHNPTAPHD